MALIGIDPDATSVVEVGGAKFVVGVMPAGMWQRIKSRNISAYEKAQRKVLAELTASGQDPNEIVVKSDDGKIAVSRLTFLTNNDSDLASDLVSVMAEAVRWSVRSHEGFLKPDGSPVPFETEQVEFEGERVKVVAPSTLRWYRVMYPLLTDVYLAARSLSDLTAVEKKVSPPPPSSTGSSSTVKDASRRRRR